MSNPYQNPYVDIHLTRTRATAITRAATTKEDTTKEGTTTGDTGEALATEGAEGITMTPTSQAIKATEMDPTRAIDRTTTMMLLIAVPAWVQPVAPVACLPSAATDVHGPVFTTFYNIKANKPSLGGGFEVS